MKKAEFYSRGVGANEETIDEMFQSIYSEFWKKNEILSKENFNRCFENFKVQNQKDLYQWLYAESKRVIKANEQSV